MNHGLPIITTVIPTRNRSGLLKKALQSILDQSYPYCKVSVYDNASEDDTKPVVQKFQKADSRVTYHRHLQNIGATNNFIFALRQVKTPYFSILSDDDYLLPGFFENAISALSRHPDCAFVALGCFVSDGRKIIRKPSINKNMAGYYAPPHSFNVMLKEWMTLTWTSILFRKSIVDQVGPLLEKPCLPNDLEFLMRIGAQYPIAISEKPGAVFTDNLSGHSSITLLEFIWPCYLEVIERITSYPSLSEMQKKEAQRVLLGRLKKRLIYSSLSYICRGDNQMAEEARLPLEYFSHAGLTAALLKIIIAGNAVAPWLTNPLVSLFIRKKHTVIYLLESIQHLYRLHFPRSLR